MTLTGSFLPEGARKQTRLSEFQLAVSHQLGPDEHKELKPDRFRRPYWLGVFILFQPIFPVAKNLFCKVDNVNLRSEFFLGTAIQYDDQTADVEIRGKIARKTSAMHLRLGKRFVVLGCGFEMLRSIRDVRAQGQQRCARSFSRSAFDFGKSQSTMCSAVMKKSNAAYGSIVSARTRAKS